MNLIIVVNMLILNKSGDSDESEYSGDSVESGEYDKSGYPSEYCDRGDSHETCNYDETNFCVDSDGFCGSEKSGD